MPNQAIHAKHDPTWFPPENPDADGSMPGVEVQWSSHPSESTVAAVAIGCGHLDKRVPPAVDLHPEYDGIGPIATPYYVHLNRSEINDLIRTLRRARNAVFGGDE